MRDHAEKSIVWHRSFVNVLIWTFYKVFMGISQKAVYITSLFAIKERIIHRDMTVPGGHVPVKMTEAGATGFRHTIVF